MQLPRLEKVCNWSGLWLLFAFLDENVGSMGLRAEALLWIWELEDKVSRIKQNEQGPCVSQQLH